MSNRILNFALVIAVLVVGELILRPAIAAAFFLAVNDVHPLLAPLWMATPNLVWYAIIGALVTWRLREQALLFNGVIFIFAAGLMWFLQYPRGIWISEDFYAYSVALAPICALPLGIVLGFWFVRWRQAHTENNLTS